MRVLIGYLGENLGLIYSTPLAKQIKSDFSDAHITWAVSKSSKYILDGNPDIDEYLILDDNNTINGVDIYKFADEKYKQNIFDEVIFSQISYNFSNYDGVLRTSILKAYKNKYTIPLNPYLYLNELEMDEVQNFVSSNFIFKFKNKILIDCSSESIITPQFAYDLSLKIVDFLPDTCVVLTEFPANTDTYQEIIDGSHLNLKQFAYLTNYMNLIVGSNDSIIEASQSDLGKQVPTILLYDSNSTKLNSLKYDLDYWEINNDHIIELFGLSEEKLIGAIEAIFEMGGISTLDLFNELLPNKYSKYLDELLQKINETDDINLVSKSLLNFIRRNGWNFQLIEFTKDFILSPEYILTNNYFNQISESLNEYLLNGISGISEDKMYNKNDDDDSTIDIELLDFIAFGSNDDENVNYNYLDLLENETKEEKKDYLISAIVSVYNAEKYIKGCLDDLVNQTIFDKTEVIIIDSCSPQNEFIIINEYLKKYHNIKYFRTEKRETVYQAWNRGIELASGKYLTNANTDDRHRNDAFEILTNLLDQNLNIGIVYADSLITNIDNDTIEKTKSLIKYEWPDYNLGVSYTTSIFGPHPVWRKSVHNKIGLFKDEFKIVADYELFTSMAANFGALHINETLGLYLERKDSVSGAGNRTEILAENELLKEKFNELYSMNQIFPNLKDLTRNEEKSIINFTWANTLAFGPYTSFQNASKYYEAALDNSQENTDFYIQMAKLIRNNLGLLMFKIGKNEDAKTFWRNNYDFKDSVENLKILENIENDDPNYSVEMLYPSILINDILCPSQSSIKVKLDENGNFIYYPNSTIFLDVFNGANGVDISNEELLDIKNKKSRKSLNVERNYVISAIVVCDNSDNQLIARIDNLLNQTLGKSLEIIIINTNNDKDIHNVIFEYLTKYDNIIYYQNSNALSEFKALNQGIKLANGKYISRAVISDKYRNDALEIMIKVLENYPEYTCVYPDSIVANNTDETFENNNIKLKNLLPDANLGIFLSASCFGTGPVWNKAIHNTIGYFDEEYEIASDYDFFLKLAERFKMIHLRESLILTNKSENNKENFIKYSNEVSQICYKHRDSTDLEVLYKGLSNFKNDLYTLASVIIDYSNIWILSAYGNFDKASFIIQNLMEITKPDNKLSEEVKRIVKNNLAVYFFCIKEYELAFDYISTLKDDEICKYNFEKMSIAKENKINLFPDDFVILELPSDLLDNSRICEYLSIDINGNFNKGTSYRRFWDTYFGIDGIDNNTSYEEYDRRFRKDKNFDIEENKGIIKTKTITSNDKKRVLFTMFGWDNTGGGTQFPRELANSLKERGWEVGVFYAGTQHSDVRTPYYLEKKNIDDINLFGVFNRPTEFLDAGDPLREIEDREILNLFNDCLNEFNPDLIHYHNFLGLSFRIAEIAHLRNIPSVFTPHNHHIIDPQLYMINGDLSVWKNSNFFENSSFYSNNMDLTEDFQKRFNYSRQVLNEYIDYTLAISNRTKEILLDFGIKSEKVKVVHQIPESINLLKRKDDYKTQLPLRIGYIGSIITIKGIHNIVLALNEIDESKVSLKIYGDGNSSYIDSLKQMQRTNNIEWNGRYDYNQLSKIAEDLDVLVMPSIVEEGAGLVLLEALAMGLPVIASRIGGIPDFIEDNFNGRLYQYNSYQNLKSIIEDFVNNPEKLFNLKKNAILLTNRNDYLNHLEKIYFSLIEKSDFIDKFGKFNIDINKINTKIAMIEDDNSPMNRKKLNEDLAFGFSNKDATGKMPNPLPSPLLLNLGCGKDIREGFVNIDLFSNDNQVVKMDIRRLEIEDNSVDLILASDVLEHFSHRETGDLLKEWNRVLKPNAQLIIRCPSLYLQAKAYIENVWDADIASYMIFGGQTNPGDYHCIGFDSNSIKKHLINAGFNVESIEEIDTPQDRGFINLNMTVISKKIEIEKTHKSIKNKNSNNQTESLFSEIPVKEDSKADDLVIAIEKKDKIGNSKYPLNLVWEGSQFVYHSLALVNREHCNNLIDTDLFEMSIVPYEQDQFSPELDEKFSKISKFDIRNKTENSSPDSPFLWIRHQWPPKNEKPTFSKWIINQPWEYSLLTKEFVELFNQADEIWTPSNFSRNSFINSGVDFNKVQIVPNGINPSIFKPGKSNFPLKTNKKLKFLYVGGTIYRKGIDILLKSYVKAFKKSDDVCLIIKDLGSKTFYNGQTAQSMILKLQSNPETPEILYLDESYSEEQVADLYRACNVFVSPYRGEGFSLPTLEAMACGLPVIVTDGGSTDDFVEENFGWKIKASLKSVGYNLEGKEFVNETFVLEPDEDDLKDILLSIYENPSYNFIKGLNASFKARTMWTWKKATLKLISRIDAIYDTEYARAAESKLEDDYDGYVLLGLADEDYFNKQYDEALNLFHLAIESDNLDNESMQFAYLRISMIELINNNYYTAEDYFKKAEEVYINTPDITYLKIQMLSYQKLWDEVLETVQDLFDKWSIYKFIIRTGFNLDDLFCDTANALFELDYIDDAIRLYNEALRINETNTNIYVGAAKCYLAQEDFELAKEVLDKAIEFDSENTEAKELRKNIGF